MELEVPRAWVRVGLQLRADGMMAVSVETHAGLRQRAPRVVLPGSGWSTVPLDLPGMGLVFTLVPDLLASWTQEALTPLPLARSGPHGADPVTLPVFLTPPPGLERLGWESIALRLFPTVLAQRLSVVIDRAQPKAPSSFRLPLQLLAVGTRASEAVAALEARGIWLGRNVETPGQVAEVRWADDAADAVGRLAEQDAGIVLADGWVAAELAQRRWGGGVANLVIVLGVGAQPAFAVDQGPAAARSVLVLGGPADPSQLQLVVDFLDALSHDRPLHESASIVRSRSAGRWVRLEANPVSVHDLRLADAWSELVRQSYSLAATVGSGRLDAANIRVDMVGADLPEAERADPFGTALSEARDLDVSFGMERQGLYPLGRAAARLGRAEHVLRLMGRQFGPDQVAATQAPRVLNIGLRRAEDAWAPGASSVYVDANRSLVAGADYDLDVQVGGRWPTTLVEGDPPAIDLLLPDDREGHLLEVVAFSADFQIRSGAAQPLRLPPKGASGVVVISIRAPERTGPVELRVGVYLRGYLVQSYRLRALVENFERRHPKPVLGARLEHSATARWENLGSLPERRLSLTMNQGKDGTHHLFVKGGEVAAVLSLASELQVEEMRAFRDVLVRLVDRKIDDEQALRELANRGARLFHGLFNRLPKSQDVLRRFRGVADEVVQIVRIDPHYVLPWSIVYDWDMPTSVFGAAPATVCFGEVHGGAACDHGPTSGVVCARGFWGVRHRVEELLGDPTERDMAQRIALRAPPVVMSLGVDDVHTRDLRGQLAATLGADAVRSMAPADTLLDILFDAGTRPPVLVVLGHHETRDIVGEPPGARISTGTADGWLISDRITERAVNDGRWQEPNPLVMLLSCGSAAVEPQELTSFLTALNGVGACALVGTECDIFSDLAARVAQDLLSAMVGPAALGLPARTCLATAVQRARQQLIVKEKDVRAFAFAAFGPADTELVGA